VERKKEEMGEERGRMGKGEDGGGGSFLIFIDFIYHWLLFLNFLFYRVSQECVAPIYTYLIRQNDRDKSKRGKRDRGR
jgi:hypothetical protein